MTGSWERPFKRAGPGPIFHARRLPGGDRSANLLNGFYLNNTEKSDQLETRRARCSTRRRVCAVFQPIRSRTWFRSAAVTQA